MRLRTLGRAVVAPLVVAILLGVSQVPSSAADRTFVAAIRHQIDHVEHCDVLYGGCHAYYTGTAVDGEVGRPASVTAGVWDFRLHVQSFRGGAAAGEFTLTLVGDPATTLSGTYEAYGNTTGYAVFDELGFYPLGTRATYAVTAGTGAYAGCTSAPVPLVVSDTFTGVFVVAWDLSC